MNRKLLPLLMTAGVLVALFVAASCMYEGFGSALAGVAATLYTGSGNPAMGVGLELDAIAAVVIGGTLLTGGVGHLGAHHHMVGKVAGQFGFGGQGRRRRQQQQREALLIKRH